MIILKQTLQEALKIVEPGLAKSDIPQLETARSFAFAGGNIITFNDEVSVSHPIEGWSDIEGIVHAEKLYQLLSKLTTKEIEVFVNKKSELVIKSGKAKAGITLQTEFELPVIDDMKKLKWKKLPDLFLDAVKFTVKCASTDLTDPILLCLHVSKSGFVESSDSYRIANFDLNEEMPVKTFLSPAKSMIKMIEINPVEIAEGSGWVHFRSEEGTVFSCRTVDETFPDTKPHLNVEGTQLLFPDELREVILRAMIFAERSRDIEEFITLSIKENSIKVRSEAEVSGWFEEDIDFAYNGTPMEFSSHPYLLKDVLLETRACTINKEKTRIKFRGSSWSYMAALKVS